MSLNTLRARMSANCERTSPSPAEQISLSRTVPRSRISANCRRGPPTPLSTRSRASPYYERGTPSTHCHIANARPQAHCTLASRRPQWSRVLRPRRPSARALCRPATRRARVQARLEWSAMPCPSSRTASGSPRCSFPRILLNRAEYCRIAGSCLSPGRSPASLRYARTSRSEFSNSLHRAMLSSDSSEPRILAR